MGFSTLVHQLCFMKIKLLYSSLLVEERSTIEVIELALQGFPKSAFPAITIFVFGVVGGCPSSVSGVSAVIQIQKVEEWIFLGSGFEGLAFW